ncbi:hypothetical protein R6Z07F_013848 [Ovis aries]
MHGSNRVCQVSPEPGRSAQQRPNSRVLTPEYPAPTRLHYHLRGARAQVQREQGAAHPAPGPSPRACCLPRTHCPRELRRLAWNNAAVQKRRPTTLGSQDQEFPGCPTDYFRSLVPTPPLAPTPEPPATSPRPCTRASGGCGISSHWVTCLFQLLGHTLAPPRLFLPARPQAFTSHTTLGRLNRSLSDAWHFEMTSFQKLDTTSQKAFPISPLLWPPHAHHCKC